MAEIESIEGIGPIVAQGLYNFLHDPQNIEEIQLLAALGVNMEEKVSARNGPLAGDTIVVTGALDRWSRNEVEILIKQLGGRVTSAISKRTSYLVAGEGGGTKHTKAEEYNVEILSEADFINRLHELGWDD